MLQESVLTTEAQDNKAHVSPAGDEHTVGQTYVIVLGYAWLDPMKT